MNQKIRNSGIRTVFFLWVIFFSTQINSALSGTPPPTYTPSPAPTSTPEPFSVIHVPLDFWTIQAALNESTPQTLILVSPGTYYENLTWPEIGGIRLETEGPAGSVTINGDYQGRVICISDVPDPGASIRGFRITKGRHGDGGAGMLLENSIVHVSGCEIFNNAAEPQGTRLIRPGIVCRRSELTMVGCHIHDHLGLNSDGAGLTIDNIGESVVLDNCIFTRNDLLSGNGFGAAVSLLNGKLQVINCTFAENILDDSTVIYLGDEALVVSNLILQSECVGKGCTGICTKSDPVYLLYNTIADNHSDAVRIDSSGTLLRGNIISGNISGLYCVLGSYAFLEYNDVWSNEMNYAGILPGETDISVDPMFVSTDTEGYFLANMETGQFATSPCVDSGDPLTTPWGTTRTDYEPDTERIDMGYHRLPESTGPPATWTPTPGATPTPPHPTSTPSPTQTHATPTHPENVILVPEEFSTIQDALDAAEFGNTISVAVGIYSGPGNRDISCRGKDIVLKSRNGPEQTIIECNGNFANPHRGFIFEHNESHLCVISGFTIKDGFAMGGGGIFIRNSASPRIEKCKFKNCRASSFGGAVYAVDSNFFLENSTISNCVASDEGGGIVVSGQNTMNAVIYQVSFLENSCSGTSMHAGGITILQQAHLYLTSCIFTGNSGPAVKIDGGPQSITTVANCLFTQNSVGIEAWNGYVDIGNCTFSGNSAAAVRGHAPDSIVNLMRCCLWGTFDTAVDITSAQYCNMPGQDDAGDFYADPLFCEGPLGTFYIQQGSEFSHISPNLNTGNESAFKVKFQGPGYEVNLTSLTTAPNEVGDTRFADIGYHYPFTNPAPTPTSPPPSLPIIEDIIGSTDDFDTSSTASFFIAAQVSHPLGLSFIDSVQLFLDNIPIPFQLYDNGTNGDFNPNDGIYSIQLTFAPFMVPPSDYHLYVVAYDKSQHPSEKVPYVLSIEKTEPEIKPKLAGRYIYYNLVESGKNEWGILWILTRIQHPDGLDKISHVELLYEGLPTGLELFDDGLHRDLEPDDGYYGFSVFYNGMQVPEPVEINLQIQATDISGNKSEVWPLAWKVTGAE